VLAALAGLRQWASHAEIAQALPEPLDRVTLYRTLDTLVEARLVARNVGDDRIGRFALAGEGAHDEHAHFHCADCGRVFCLPTPVPRRMSVPGGFAVQAVDLNVRGRCDACSARAG
jgi:Fur family ferric uptake transcriptional regulator